VQHDQQRIATLRLRTHHPLIDATDAQEFGIGHGVRERRAVAS
jgi:hypothetical protein